MLRKEFAQHIALKIISYKRPEATTSEKSSYIESEVFAMQVLPQIEDLVNSILQTWKLEIEQFYQPVVFQSFDNIQDAPLLSMEGGPENLTSTSNVARGEGTPGGHCNKQIQTIEAAKMPPKSEPFKPKTILETATLEPAFVPEQADVKQTSVSSPFISPVVVNTTHKPELKVWTEPVVFQLPNANVGQAYEATIAPVKFVPGLEVRLTKVAEYFGLSFDKETGCLKGLPTKDGTFDIEVTFVVEGYQGVTTSLFKLIVNPDPKSLWKNLPSDSQGLYAKPDEDGLLITGSDGFTLVAGSKRGRSHAQKGTYRDDDFFIHSRKDGWQIAIVSDGAGSAKYSRRGSQIICQHGGKFLDHTLDQGASANLNEAVTKWYEASLKDATSADELRKLRNGLYTTLGHTAFDAMKTIHKEVDLKQEIGAVAKDFSSTALLALVKRFPFGVFCGAFAVGDGAIGVYLADGTPLLLSEPDGGEFSGQTRFLSNDTVSGDELVKRLRHALIPESSFKGLYLMTDGVSDPFFQTDKGMTMPDRWLNLISQIESSTELSKRPSDAAKSLVDWLDFWSKGEHDDRTLAVIY